MHHEFLETLWRRPKGSLFRPPNVQQLVSLNMGLIPAGSITRQEEIKKLNHAELFQ